MFPEIWQSQILRTKRKWHLFNTVMKNYSLTASDMILIIDVNFSAKKSCLSSLFNIQCFSHLCMAWIRGYRSKKLVSNILVDSSFTFSSYAWLCVFHCSHRLLCWIKSRVRDFLWKLLSFHTEKIQPNSFGKVCFLEDSYKNVQKIQILKILRAPSIRCQWVCL